MPSQRDIDHQQSLLKIHRRNLDHYLTQQATLGTAHTPPGVIHGIESTREQIAQIKQTLRGWHVPVEDMPDDDTTRPTPAPSATLGAAPHTSRTPQQLRDLLATRFSMSELNDALFDLNIDPDDIPSTDRREKSREFVQYMQRRNRLSELEQYIRNRRPDIDF